MTALKVGAAIAVLVYLERRGSSACAGKANGTACGPLRANGRPDRICWTGQITGGKPACLENRHGNATYEDGGSTDWFGPLGALGEGFGSFFEQAQGWVGFNSAGDDGPVTSTTDPRLNP